MVWVTDAVQTLSGTVAPRVPFEIDPAPHWIERVELVLELRVVDSRRLITTVENAEQHRPDRAPSKRWRRAIHRNCPHIVSWRPSASRPPGQRPDDRRAGQHTLDGGWRRQSRSDQQPLRSANGGRRSEPPDSCDREVIPIKPACRAPPLQLLDPSATTLDQRQLLSGPLHPRGRPGDGVHLGRARDLPRGAKAPSSANHPSPATGERWHSLTTRGRSAERQPKIAIRTPGRPSCLVRRLLARSCHGDSETKPMRTGVTERGGSEALPGGLLVLRWCRG
jgi:hypothetical protein